MHCEVGKPWAKEGCAAVCRKESAQNLRWELHRALETKAEKH